MSLDPAPTTAGAPAAGRRAARLLSELLPEAVTGVEEEYGEVTVRLRVERLVEAARLLRDHPQGRYTLPLLVTAVDHPDREPDQPRFDIIHQLRSLAFNDVCRLMVQVSESRPVVPSLERCFAGFDWHEREAYDLLGIEFDGHHDLRRILMPDDWDGHPLRRDYVSFGEPVAFTHNLEWALPARERPPDMPGSLR